MKILILSLFILIISITPMTSGIAETSEDINTQIKKVSKKRYNAKETSHITAYLPLKYKKKYYKNANYLDKKFSKGLTKISYLYLISKKDMNTYAGKSWKIPRCSDNSCAQSIGKNLKAHRVIYGKVEIYEKRYLKEIGKTGADKYLLNLKKPVYYVITINLLRTKDKKILVTIKEKTWDRHLAKTIKKILKQIEDQYKKRPVPVVKKVIKPKKKEKAKPLFSLNLAGTVIIPFSIYNNYSDIGGGFTITPEVRNLFLENLVFQLPIGYYYLQNKKEDIKHLHAVQLSLLSGYTFPIPFKKISAIKSKYLITPLLGVGYNIHIVNETDGDLKHFADPFLTLQCQFDFKVHDKMYLFITPGINFIFENSQIGMHALFHFGYKVSF